MRAREPIHVCIYVYMLTGDQSVHVYVRRCARHAGRYQWGPATDVRLY